MSTADRAFIHELKQAEPFTGVRAEAASGRSYKFQIVGRGETAFVQLGDKGLLFESLVGQGVVFAATIRRWDDRSPVTDDERDDIVQIASSYLADKGATEVDVVR